MDTPKWIYFQNRDELLRIDLNKVVYFEADANYTNIFTVNQMKAVLGMNLSNTQQVLSHQPQENMPNPHRQAETRTFRLRAVHLHLASIQGGAQDREGIICKKNGGEGALTPLHLLTLCNFSVIFKHLLWLHKKY